jgi:hypothetical protein
MNGACEQKGSTSMVTVASGSNDFHQMAVPVPDITNVSIPNGLIRKLGLK